MSNTSETSEKKAFYRMVLAVALPIALQSLLTQLVEASDTLMLGVLSQDALAAISLATQVHFVLNMIFVAQNIVISAMSAQYYGKGDPDTVEKVCGFGMKLSIGISSLFFAAAIFAPRLLMTCFTNEPELIRLGAQYLRIVSFSYLFIGMSQVYLSIMKNTGRVAKSSLFSSTAVVLNLIFNALLIYGLLGLPKMEIRGAALATVIARGVEFGLCVIESSRTTSCKFRIRYFLHDDKAVRSQYLHLLPASLANMIIWGLGQTAFSVIIGHLGTDVVAANSLANIVKRLCLSFCMGVGNGSSVIVGHELGANNLDKAKVYAKRLLWLSVLLGAVSGVILIVLTPAILAIATTITDTARRYLRYMLYMSSYYLVGKAANTVFVHGCFWAGGDTRFGLVCDAINLWCFIIPIGAMLAFVFHVPVLVVYGFLYMDEIVKIPAEIIHYRKYKWLKNITIRE